MKISQKGFIAPLLLALIALLLIGGGAYVYIQNKQPNQPATIPTSDWKTYTNSQYKFQFMYPADAEIKVNDSVGLYGNQVAGVDVNIYPRFTITPNDDASKWFEITASSDQSTCTVISSTSSGKIINGINYVVAPWTNGGGTQTWSSVQLLDTVKNGVCYQIKESISGHITNLAPNYNLDQEKQIFDQIVSTFEFIPS